MNTGQGQPWDLVGRTEDSYEISFAPPYPGTRSHDSSFRNTSSDGAERLVGERYFRENEFTLQHAHKSLRFFPVVNARRPAIYGIPNAVRSNLLVRESKEHRRCRCLCTNCYRLNSSPGTTVVPLEIGPRVTQQDKRNSSSVLLCPLRSKVTNVPNEISVPLFAYLQLLVASFRSNGSRFRVP